MKQGVNYIEHQKAAYTKMVEDNRLTPIHISLYISLFMIWNESGFDTELSIARNDVMKLSKIGSANTYTKSLKELDDYGYIKYTPSFNPLKGSRVTIITFDKGSDKGTDKGSGTGTNKGTGNSSDKGSDTLSKQKQTTETNKPLNNYQLFIDAYNEFCKKILGVPAKINGAEGNAMKSIIAYIEKVSEQKKSVPVDSWQFILDSFNKWEPFHQKQIKLTQINSNLPNIINSIKNGNKQPITAHQQNLNDLADLSARAREAKAALAGQI